MRNSVRSRELGPVDKPRNEDNSWAGRCNYWLTSQPAKRLPGRARRQIHEPLVLTGHGLSIAVKHGALLIKSGFTHYPQKRVEYRFFPADDRLPSRIIIVDGSGALSLDAIGWLSAQQVPLIQLDWRGNVQTVIGGNGFAIDPNKQHEQIEAIRQGRLLEIATDIVIDKIENSIDTLRCGLLPRPSTVQPVETLRRLLHFLGNGEIPSIKHLLSVEAQAAVAYFGAWYGIPLNWQGTKRKAIPESWYRVGVRSSGSRQKIANRFTRHPVNAILNYAYAVLESQVRIHIATQGYDPNIGYLHKPSKERPALVFDLIEPQRPIVDRKVLKFVKAQTFHPADFTIRADGVCRLNPEMAKHIVGLVVGSADLLTKFGF